MTTDLKEDELSILKNSRIELDDDEQDLYNEIITLDDKLDSPQAKPQAH